MDSLFIEIHKELFAPGASKQFDGKFCTDIIEGKVDYYKIQSPISYQIIISNTGDGFLVTGELECRALTSCARCLEEVELELKGHVDSFFLNKRSEDITEDEIVEFEILPSNHKIDLSKLICQTLLADAPLKPLCNEKCKGLCPECGCNLNKANCSCGKDPKNIYNPFYVLKELKIE